MTGGTWSSSNTAVAVVSGAGSVFGIASGTAIISYAVTNMCGTSVVAMAININTFPTVSGISGPSTICTGMTGSLTDAVSGGVWSSLDPSVATIDPASGSLLGVSSGSVVIDYALTNACGTASTTTTILVNPGPDAGSISGAGSVCIGSNITLTESVSGGVWSALNGDATVAGGVVTGITGGLDIISYSVTNSCGTASAVQTVTVNNYPLVDSVLGVWTTVCAGSSITFSDATPGGTWTTSNGSASVTLGVVTGIAAGVDTVIYAVANSCATVSAVRIITVEPTPNAGTISGPSGVCTGASITLTDAATGGVWSGSNSNATVLSGVVTGVISGTDTIYYSVSNSCGTVSTSHLVTINASPNAGTVTGSTGVCLGSSITLTDAAIGGAWSSSNLNASVTGGVVTGITAGLDTISYTVTNSCGTAVAIKAISINTIAGAGAITGSSTVCVGGSINLTDAITGGVWSSSGPDATVSTGGLVTGLSAGIDTIRYTASNGCGSATTTKLIAIISAPYAGSISGASTVCEGLTIDLSDAVPGGAWSSQDASVATVSGGVVTGVTAGVDNITYSVTNACGTVSAVHSITVLSPEECNTGVNPVNKGAAAELKVYPNPNGGTFSLSLLSDIDEPVHVTITDVLGQKITELSIMTNKEVQITLNQAAGVYMVTATTGNGRYLAKITVE